MRSGNGDENRGVVKELVYIHLLSSCTVASLDIDKRALCEGVWLSLERGGVDEEGGGGIDEGDEVDERCGRWEGYGRWGRMEKVTIFGGRI